MLLLVTQLRTEVVFCRGCDERMVTVMIGVRLLLLWLAVAVGGEIVEVVDGRQMVATVGKIVESSCKIVQFWKVKNNSINARAAVL